MDKWEYKKELLPNITYVNKLNAYGADGWELISSEEEKMHTGQGSITDTYFKCLFKRKKT